MSIMNDLSTWWEGLSASDQAFFGTFIPIFVVLAITNIRHRIKRNRLGVAAPPKKSSAGQIFWGIVLVWVLYALRSRVPLIDVILGLPGRIWPSFDDHIGVIYVAFLASMAAAAVFSALYAALFIRRPAPQPVGSAAVVATRTTTTYWEE